MEGTPVSSRSGRAAPGASGLRIERVALALGLGLFLWLLHRIGLGVLAQNLSGVGWGFGLVLALELVPLLLLTSAWRCTLPSHSRIPFRRLVSMRLAGDAVNALAPAAVVGGELLRARLLASFLPMSEAIASVALAAATQFLGQILYVGMGSVALPDAVLRPGFRFAGPAAALLILLLAWWLVVRQRPGPSDAREQPAFIADLTRGGLASRIRLLRESVVAIVRAGSGRLALSVLLFLVAWSIGTIEVGLILRLLGVSVSLRTALSISVLIVLVEGIFFFVPLRAGVSEGGFYAIFLLLGLDPATGFSLAIVRRLRELAWALAGLMLLGIQRRTGARVAEAVAPVSRADRSRF